MFKKYVIFLVLCVIFFSQPIDASNSSVEIDTLLRKFANTGTVLYVAAHPDDENTRLISSLSKEYGLRVAYVSLTRGDGGQNLIGKEQGDLLGFIRTEELLQARNIDGGEQYFSRARDFGYSKTAEETFQIWDKNEVLSDLVYLIRDLRPDIMITRFEPDSEGHGHHKASAILAHEAYRIAGDRKAFPEHLKNGVKAWEVKKLLHNKSTWHGEDYSKDPDLIRFEVNNYSSTLGKTYSEIAAQSRTMHKSQGFGDRGTLGSLIEYFDVVEVRDGFDSTVMFDDFDFTFNQIDPSIKIKIDTLLTQFNFRKPADSIPALLHIRKEIQKKDFLIKEQKLKEIDEIISKALGFSARVEFEKKIYNSGEKAKIHFVSVYSGQIPLHLESYSVLGQKFSLTKDLERNIKFAEKNTLKLPANQKSIPFWLKEKGQKGLYEISDLKMRTAAVEEDLRTAKLKYSIEGQKIEIGIDIGAYHLDSLRGEVRSYISVIPSETEEYEEKVELGYAEKKSKEKQSYYDFSYEHFPAARVVFENDRNFLNLKKEEGKALHIAYFQGSGDQIPEVLKTLGHTVEEFNTDSTKDFTSKLESGNFDAVVLGIRVLNVNPEIGKVRDKLLGFVKNGGVVITQYATVNRLSNLVSNIWPYTVEISTTRITDENSSFKILDPSHPVFSSKYKITNADFDAWIQERGVYFAEKWDSAYDAPLAFNDPGEAETAGGLLISKIGEGYFIYTGISFFRQIPKGVEGATKLFLNMLYLNHASDTDNE